MKQFKGKGRGKGLGKPGQGKGKGGKSSANPGSLSPSSENMVARGDLPGFQMSAEHFSNCLPVDVAAGIYQRGEFWIKHVPIEQNGLFLECLRAQDGDLLRSQRSACCPCRRCCTERSDQPDRVCLIGRTREEVDRKCHLSSTGIQVEVGSILVKPEVCSIGVQTQQQPTESLTETQKRKQRRRRLRERLQQQ